MENGQPSQAGIPVPGSLAFVPADARADSLSEALATAGFDLSRPAFASWLGVTIYLDDDAIARTLAAVADFAPGSELVFDHMLPAGLRDADGAAYAEAVMPVAAGRGEPWLTFTGPPMPAGV